MMTCLLMALMLLTGNYAQADNQSRELEAFSEINLRVDAKLHLEQGDKQSVEIVAKGSTLDELVTEVKNRELVIRFKTKNLLWKDFETGKIEIFITVPDITALTVSGSGDIDNDGPLEARILSLTLSGSGSIKLDDLKSERVKAIISGSGNMELAGNSEAEDLSINISGSGGFRGTHFESRDVTVRVSGSGNAYIHCTNSLIARVLGSGSIYYEGNPRIDQSIGGSGQVKEL
ncbi:putative autotransporter adhesin-like protein [Mangrovibacterium marinum]|uniref:Putative autotransporter adhesin-like protein n=2 Tax=Mangrovibacterium marinum TaxID=1639118 RepID=A0A2T5C6H9_9BACT|nr:putative autotransporter adhesin-like protein [Mangrovibacterium marinum]